MSGTSNDLPVISYNRSDIQSFITPQARSIHKGDRGSVLIVGGSENYRGAPLLAAMGALRSGAGLVALAVPDFMVDFAASLLPEAIFIPLRCDGGVISDAYIIEPLSPWFARCDALVLGPGIGRNNSVQNIIKLLWNNFDKPLLLDADALYFFGTAIEEVSFRKDVIITPHCGEAAHILGCTVEKISNDRKSSVLELGKKAGVALLKGMETLVNSHGEVRKITEGSPALAVPGSGDVLSGVIGALAASGMSTFDAATLGALLHATAGSDLEKNIGVNGVLAREIADALPFAFR